MANPLSDVQICNLALSRIGIQQVILSLNPPDNSVSAAQCSLWYGFCRDYLLRAFAWPWAIQWAALTQVSITGTPANWEWDYSYRWPVDCLTVRRIMPQPQPTTGTTPPIFPNIPLFSAFSRLWKHEDVNSQPVLYGMSSDASGKLIVTNLPNAWIEYSQAVTDSTQFAQDFASLLAWRLAMELSMTLARSDDRRAVCEKQFSLEWVTATARALNEKQASQSAIDDPSEFIRYRYS